MNEAKVTHSTASAPASGRVALISVGIFAACGGLSLAYGHGFRITEPGFWNGNPKERLFLSIPDLLLFFASMALGIIALLVAAISIGVWLTRHLRHTSNDNTRNV